MSSPSPMAGQSPALKTYFKTPEGRYKLQYEKTHPTNILHFNHGRSVSQVTLANLREKSSSAQAPTTPTGQSSSSGVVRLAAAKLLGGGNGNRFVGGNGTSKGASASGKIGGSSTGVASGGAGGSPVGAHFDGKGTYLVFNIGDTLFISDFNSQDKDPIKVVQFGSANPVCHAFDADARDGHDLVIGMSSGDVYTVSLRQQLQDAGKKLVGAQHYNKDGIVNNSRCTTVAWVPGGYGTFAVGHADGNFYVYDKTKDGTADPSFPAIKDQSHFTVAHARSSKSNPLLDGMYALASINNISFSIDGSFVATVGRDGNLRVFDYSKEQLICGGKSYYGALLCCAWSPDGKYILTGGEDDLVQVWSMDERKIVAWGEGHNSWVSGVAFDSYWSPPSSDEGEENVVYRFGSVGQDTQLLLWDLVIEELVVPLRRPSGGSPTFSSGSPSSAHWDNIAPVGTLHPAPSMRDVPKLSPVVAHRAHVEPLSGLAFTNESVVTGDREGHLKIWVRPGHADSQQSSTTSESSLGASGTKDRAALPPIKTSSTYKPSPILG